VRALLLARSPESYANTLVDTAFRRDRKRLVTTNS